MGKKRGSLGFRVIYHDHGIMTYIYYNLLEKYFIFNPENVVIIIKEGRKKK